MRTIKVLFIGAMIFFSTSCSNTKYLKDGELLYTGGTVKVTDKSIKKKERKVLTKNMEELLRPRPNKKILGLRIKLYAYNIAGEPKKEKGLRYWLRNKVGEPPVTFGKVDLAYNADILRNYLENNGYFQALATADSTRTGKKASADYTAAPGPQWKIRNVIFPSDTAANPLPVEIAISATRGKKLRRGILKEGDPYNLNAIKAERERIDAKLKERGYYFFNPDYLLMQVDTTAGKHQTDIVIRLKEETPDKAKEVYTINDIVIYPNYSITGRDKYQSKDSLMVYKDFQIIDTAKTFNPRIFDRTMTFGKGDIYNRTDHNLALNRLINLGPFKFVKNEFKVDSTLKNTLDAYYYLTPLPKKSFRVEVLGKTNSANYAGSELNLNWSNRNTFTGAELLTISAFGGLEVQVSGQNKGFNVYRFGTEMNLIWPRILAPIKLNTSGDFVPRTKLTVGYEFQKRMKLYSLNSFKTSFGYLFKQNIRKEHELNLQEITYVSPANVSDLYKQQIAATPALQRVIDRQLIFGPNYSYTYTNTMRARKKNTIYFKGQIEAAGTIAGLATGANVRQGDTIKVFNIPFSQFGKLEAEFRHYLRLTDETKLASRIIVGVGYPYGNSSALPFIKQFFIGGTNSIRAFRARSIGPGTFREPVNANAFLPDQSGDIKLEMNTEYRAKLFSVVDGALFIDAGNIWLMNEDPLKPGAKFSNKFLSELAVGTGAGIRLDLSFLILRLDLAFPLRKPYLPENNRWVLDKIQIGNGAWRKENLVFNLAIGYPF